MDEYIWLDIVCINQNSKNIKEDLEILPIVYENSKNHFILTCKCFERSWCIFEIMIFNQKSKFLSSSKVLSKKPKSLFLLSNGDFQNLLDFYCAQENISLKKRNTLKNLDIENNDNFEEICNKMKELLSVLNNFHKKEKEQNKIIIENFNKNVKKISFVNSQCYYSNDKTEIEKNIIKLCSIEEFDLFLQQIFTDKLNKFIKRITRTNEVIKGIVIGSSAAIGVTLLSGGTLIGPAIGGVIGPTIGVGIGAVRNINKEIYKTKEI